MTIRYIIHLSHNQWCRCFSERDLAVNIAFMIKENLHLVSVERVS